MNPTLEINLAVELGLAPVFRKDRGQHCPICYKILFNRPSLASYQIGNGNAGGCSSDYGALSPELTGVNPGTVSPVSSTFMKRMTLQAMAWLTERPIDT